MRPVSRPLLLCAAGLTVVAAGCGSSGDSSSTPPPQPPPTAKVSSFPSAKGKTLDSLRAGLPEGPILAPSTTSSIEVGKNRMGFALFTADRKQILDAQVALYTTNHDGTGVKGPFVARYETLKVKPQYESKTTANDPDGAKAVYVADVPIPKAGQRVVTGVARVNGRMVRTTGFEISIPKKVTGGPPDVGQSPPVIQTKTLSDVARDAPDISTRQPPPADRGKSDQPKAGRNEATSTHLPTP